MNSFLSELLENNIIICPDCRSDRMRLADTQISCRECGHQWPVRNDVPDFFNQYHDTTGIHRVDPTHPDHGSEEDRELIDIIMRALALDHTDHYEAVKDIVSRARTWSCHDQALSAEINHLKDRFAPAAHTVPQHPDIPATANSAPSIELVRHYFPEKAVAGGRIRGNIRVKNTGVSTWSSRTSVPLYLSMFWTDHDQTRIDLKADLVFLPVDIVPGRSISIPMHTPVPLKNGTYRVHACLLLRGESTGVVSQCGFKIKVVSPPSTVKEKFLSFFIRPSTPSVCPIFKAAIPDYGQDHAAGLGIFTSQLKKLDRRFTHVLEVGSGTHPQTAWLPQCKVVALDISSPMLELGSLFFAQQSIPLKPAFMCADAFYPPFKEESFDAIAMFSALPGWPPKIPQSWPLENPPSIKSR